MESFFIRYRNLLVLLAILLAQIIGLAVQVRRTGRRAQHARPAGRVRRAADPALGRCAGHASGAADPRRQAGHVESSGRTILTCAACASRTRICSRPSTGCAWSRPRCWKTHARASACRRCSTSSRSTSTRRWPRRPSAPAAAISSRVFYHRQRLGATAWTAIWR